MRSIALCLMALAALPLAAATPAAAQTRTVQCEVESAGVVEFGGPCSFAPDTGGSFSIAAETNEGALYGEVSIIVVTVVEPGKAEVSGLTTFGNNSRWGPAERAADDSACWVGADFRICAR